jgi:hypothetical protein
VAENEYLAFLVVQLPPEKGAEEQFLVAGQDLADSLPKSLRGGTWSEEWVD